MFEDGPELRTWAVELEPKGWTEAPFPALSLARHRCEYLDYTGPVSGERGTVERVASGTYWTVADRAKAWVADLKASGLTGRLTLEALEGEAWTASWRASEHA
jgi:hypothetical protein